MAAVVGTQPEDVGRNKTNISWTRTDNNYRAQISVKYLVWTVLSVMEHTLGYIALIVGNRSTRADCRRHSYLSDRLPFLWAVYRQKCWRVDLTRMMPAVRHNDGLASGVLTGCGESAVRSLFACHCQSRSVGWAGAFCGETGYLPGMIWLPPGGSRRCGAGF